jgi:hypothetical protein
MKLNIANDFSENPFGRYLTDGPNSAERFRDEFLKPELDNCLKNKEVLNVYIDDVPLGIGPSFLEESFGGLIRKGYFTLEQLNSFMVIKTDDEEYIEEINNFLNNASAK